MPIEGNYYFLFVFDVADNYANRPELLGNYFLFVCKPHNNYSSRIELNPIGFRLVRIKERTKIDFLLSSVNTIIIPIGQNEILLVCEDRRCSPSPVSL